MAAKDTFSIRLDPDIRELLARLAKLRGTSVSRQASIFVEDGVRAAMDPERIEAWFDAQKAEALAIAAKLEKGEINDDF